MNNTAYPHTNQVTGGTNINMNSVLTTNNVIGAGFSGLPIQHKSGFKLKYKSDLDKAVLWQNFEKRGWQKTNDDDWNIYWALPWSVKMIFNPDTGYRLNEYQ